MAKLTKIEKQIEEIKFFHIVKHFCNDNCSKGEYDRPPRDVPDGMKLLTPSAYERKFFLYVWLKKLKHISSCDLSRLVTDLYYLIEYTDIPFLFEEEMKKYPFYDELLKIMNNEINDTHKYNYSVPRFICDKVIPNVLKNIDKMYLSMTNFDEQLPKNYFDNNIDWLCEALGLKRDETLYIKYSFYCQSRLFLMKFSTNIFSNSSSYVDCINDSHEVLGIPSKRLSAIYEKCGIYVNWINIVSCLHEFKSKKEFLEYVLGSVKKSNLTLDDFDNVPQKDLLVSMVKNAIKTRQKGFNVLIYGKPGTGKTELVNTLVKDLGLTGFAVTPLDCKEEFSSNAIFREESLKSIVDIRKKNLMTIHKLTKSSKNTVLLFDEAEDLFRDDKESPNSKADMNMILEENPIPCFYTMNKVHVMEKSYIRRFSLVIKMDDLSVKSTKRLLDKLSKKLNVEYSKEFENIVSQVKPSIGIIEQALKSYKISKSKNQKDLCEILLQTVTAMNYGYAPTIKALKNENKFLPELMNTDINMKELSDNIINSGELNFSILSYGCPGSSKSSYAKYLADRLGLEVIHKTYNELASCYIGETEQNITNLFKEAEEAQAMVIIDECDSLLRDRTLANRSWEVTQTEAMLTAIENFKYPVVMTTNLFNQLDEACLRRFDFKIKHKFLTVEQVILAFKQFYDLTVDKDTVSHLTKLTPGDFVTVKKRMRFIAEKTTKKYISELDLEMSNKKNIIMNDGQTKIGFN